MKKYDITVGWLYPELMSTYGDRGNIFVLNSRCARRDIETNVLNIEISTDPEKVLSCDMIFGGGAQDRQQAIIIDDLRLNKGPKLKALFEKDIPGLFVCGAPQLLGHYYMTGDGEKLQGLGIFDMESRHFGHTKPRCIGNTVAEISETFKIPGHPFRKTIVGFENHGGRTYLSSQLKPFGKVLFGSGNNGEDGTEGAIYRNCLATYSHGPFLPKNPHVADWLISKALEVKYKKVISLKPLDDSLEWEAHDFMLKRANISS